MGSFFRPLCRGAMRSSIKLVNLALCGDDFCENPFGKVVETQGGAGHGDEDHNQHQQKKA